jgi:hypothetical protein
MGLYVDWLVRSSSSSSSKVTKVLKKNLEGIPGKHSIHLLQKTGRFGT